MFCNSNQKKIWFRSCQAEFLHSFTCSFGSAVVFFMTLVTATFYEQIIITNVMGQSLPLLVKLSINHNVGRIRAA